MSREFKGKIKLDVRDSKPDWGAFLDTQAPKGAPNVLVILYDDTGQAAVRSPTRSTFLTGRNHPQNGCGSISESAVGFPGYSGHIPKECATMARVLRDAGWSTFWVGKNHNVPVDAFDIGGETNQWFPELIEDNHFVEQPAQPEDGYHFSKDIADKAISYIRDSKQSRPDKPWCLWYCPGANHAPRDYIDKYKGKFDDGYEAYRDWVLKAEVFAAFSEYTDVQAGRVIEYLEESGQLDNTLILYCADNGASGEGSPNGSVNENHFFNGYPDDIEENLAMLDKLGSADTYNGTCDPLVIHWPKGIKAKGELRHQYHHCTDIVPTILECCGVKMPAVLDGVKQLPLAGVSMRDRFEKAKARTRRKTQYYEMVGTRGIWHKGWKAATEHGPMPSDIGHFDKDRWQLFHTDQDRAEARVLADKHPSKVKELAALWLAEAKKNNLAPLMDVGVHTIHEMEYKAPPPASGRYVYYSGTTEIPEASAARTLGVSFNILAEIDFTADTQGVIVAQGSRFGGYTLFVKEGQLVFVYNFLGVPPEQRLAVAAPKAGRHIVGVEFATKSIGKNLEALGKMTLYIDDKPAASGDFRTQTGHYALCGEGLCVGYDSGDAVSKEYEPKFPFSGGEIINVVYDIATDVHLNVEKQFAAALARD